MTRMDLKIWRDSEPPRDRKLSEALQMHSDLTLSKAIAKARQSEVVQGQQTVVRKDLTLEPEKPTEIEAAQVRP